MSNWLRGVRRRHIHCSSSTLSRCRVREGESERSTNSRANSNRPVRPPQLLRRARGGGDPERRGSGGATSMASHGGRHTCCRHPPLPAPVPGRPTP
ncbi:hypothetical protein PAHAL_7G248700 [Panicum hallii]|uniref:Uncharacterized protein n=1 Tax=Panicum hallii TaxID=206008 RepID=A0A2T8IDF7_9POAL|nr:hypothetical protein PAHAL_7G248700 [Panicum hallii]